MLSRVTTREDKALDELLPVTVPLRVEASAPAINVPVLPTVDAGIDDIKSLLTADITLLSAGLPRDRTTFSDSTVYTYSLTSAS